MTETTTNYVYELADRAREAVAAWEMLPDLLPDIEGITPLCQAMIGLRALVGALAPVGTEVYPPPGVRAVAETLRRQYLSEHETTEPASVWLPQAEEIVAAYLSAELGDYQPPVIDESDAR